MARLISAPFDADRTWYLPSPVPVRLVASVLLPPRAVGLQGGEGPAELSALFSFPLSPAITHGCAAALWRGTGESLLRGWGADAICPLGRRSIGCVAAVHNSRLVEFTAE